MFVTRINCRRPHAMKAWILTLCFTFSPCLAQAPTPAPPAPGAPPATAPNDASLAAPSKEVDDLLHRLEKVSKETKTLHARLRYDAIQGEVRDEQRRFGNLVYQAGPPASFGVHFDRILVESGGKKISRLSNRWYIFDGQWLVEKLEDRKQFFKWQVVSPQTKEEDADPLALGRGPFVVPVALRRDLVVRKFEASIVEPNEKSDPKNSVHLKLTPRQGVKMQFAEIHLWYDKDTLLPQRARTRDDSKNESIVELSEVQLNKPIEGKPLETAEPKEAGWEIQVTPWSGK